MDQHIDEFLEVRVPLLTMRAVMTIDGQCDRRVSKSPLLVASVLPYRRERKSQLPQGWGEASDNLPKVRPPWWFSGERYNNRLSACTDLYRDDKTTSRPPNAITCVSYILQQDTR
ncbi:hypothetical protein R5R35_004544 [Gryllus longicercus]|uniref:Uncharacterized protein n=1 Tax=Gryllus longicercus TaxID=2509291 RepID=A0AAN9VX97_9ORTH